jgi:hypothetical protein
VPRIRCSVRACGSALHSPGLLRVGVSDAGKFSVGVGGAAGPAPGPASGGLGGTTIAIVSLLSHTAVRDLWSVPDFIDTGLGCQIG